MPARSKVAMLPAEVRTELDRRIVEQAFSGYQDLAEWLQGQGYHIAHDSVQRHGSRLLRRIEAMERLARQSAYRSRGSGRRQHRRRHHTANPSSECYRCCSTRPNPVRNRVAAALRPGHLILTQERSNYAIWCA